MAKLPAMDSLYRNALAKFNQQRAMANTGYGQVVSQNAIDQRVTKRGYDQQEQVAELGTKDDAAGRGMYSSTGYSDNLNKLLLNYRQQQDTLNRTYQRQNSDALLSRNQTLQGIGMQQNDAYTQMVARRALARAQGVV